MPSLVRLAMLLVVVACEEDRLSRPRLTPARDAGFAKDASPRDADLSDAEVEDADPTDVAQADGDALDADRLDADEPDALEQDADVIDTGVEDAGAACVSLSFDGQDRVRIPHSPSLAGGGPLTIEAWVRPETGVVNPPWYPNFVGKRNANNIFPPWVLGIRDTLQLYSVADSNWSYGSSPLALGAWSHVAAVFDGAQLRIYVNGNLDASTPASTMGPTNVEDVYLGTLPSNEQNYRGEIAGVRLSSIARYSGSFTPETTWAPDADALLLLQLDEGTGLVTFDSSGNANDGAIDGATWVAGCP